MKTSIIALSCALVAQHAFALEFTTDKTPYQTLEAEYNGSSSASLRDFSRMEDRANWAESQLICTYEVKPDTAVADVKSRPQDKDNSGFTLIEFNQLIQAGTPPQGPLFPGTPDVVAARYSIMTCGSKAVTDLTTDVSCEDIVKFTRNPNALTLASASLSAELQNYWNEFFDDIRKGSMELVPNSASLTLKSASTGYTMNVRKKKDLLLIQVLRDATDAKPAQTNYSYCWKETR